MDLKLTDFIHVHDESIDSEICKQLIDFFENNENLQERIENNKIPNFTQLNLTENSRVSPEIDNIHNYLISKVFYYKKMYYDYVDDRCFPVDNALEQFRIKKYFSEKEDQFDTHVDVTDYSSSRRFLSFLWYLNDIEEGGETKFTDFVVEARCGRLLVFPPMWMFPHKGCISPKKDKYIMSTYLHYK
jgi:hypothetical protein